jgi:hypothetical protein
MRPEEFTRMLDDRPGSVKGCEAPRDTRDIAKEALRASFDAFSDDRREAREHLEQARRERAMSIWEEAAKPEPNEATEE